MLVWKPSRRTTWACEPVPVLAEDELQPTAASAVAAATPIAMILRFIK
jgi:hypothetical protein